MTNKNVLLISAPVENIAESHYELSDVPRIGLAYLAAYLMQCGISCIAVDGKYEPLSNADILRIIEKNAIDIVGFTAMTTEIIDSAKLAEMIKNRHADMMTIVGGPHASALPGETLKQFPCFDIACFGEGELTLREIVSAIRNCRPLREIKGIAYRNEKGEILINEPRPLMEDLDALPFPAWSLFRPAKTYPILASRGCPFSCKFCMRVLGSRVRFRDPELVVKEMLEIYEKYQPKCFLFYDETFGINKDMTEKLLNSIINCGLAKKISWGIQTRVNVVNEALLRKMKAAGCNSVAFGIESGNEDILKRVDKQITKDAVRRAVASAKKAGLITRAFFIIGHPYETRATINDTINFALELDTTSVSFGIMTPYPGTEIAAMAKRGEGGYRLLSNKWSDYNKQLSNALELNDISIDELKNYQLMAYLKFYLIKFNLRKIIDLFSIINMKVIFQILSKQFMNKLLRKGTRKRPE